MASWLQDGASRSNRRLMSAMVTSMQRSDPVAHRDGLGRVV